MIYPGEPAGFVIRSENGFACYHGGNTGPFEGGTIIGVLYQSDLCLVPRGDRATMDPREEKAQAVSE